MIKAIIWDMDGVIVDSEKNYDSIILSVFREFGVNFLTLNDLRAYTGCNHDDFIKLVQQDHEFVIPAGFEKRLMEEVDRCYKEVFPLVPKAFEAMMELSKNFKMGLSTSSNRNHAETVLKRHNVWNFLEETTCGGEVENGKPAPDIYLATAEKLGVLPENCVVIEDSYRGMCGAIDAGMKVVIRKAQHNRHRDFSKSNAQIEDLALLKDVIEEI